MPHLRHYDLQNLKLELKLSMTFQDILLSGTNEEKK